MIERALSSLKLIEIISSLLCVSAQTKNAMLKYLFSDRVWRWLPPERLQRTEALPESPWAEHHVQSQVWSLTQSYVFLIMHPIENNGRRSVFIKVPEILSSLHQSLRLLPEIKGTGKLVFFKAGCIKSNIKTILMTLPGYLLSQTPKPDRPPLSPEDVLNQERKTSQMPSRPCWLKKGIYLPKQEKVFRQSTNTKVNL